MVRGFSSAKGLGPSPTTKDNPPQAGRESLGVLQALRRWKSRMKAARASTDSRGRAL